MKSLKSILITFDYELFLGSKSGSVDCCLIKPTNRILEILKSNASSAIFFIDFTYLIKLEEIESKYSQVSSDLQKIKNQIKTIISDGHKIYYHIHPHWLDAIYIPETNQWDLSNKELFSINNISESQLNSIFEKVSTFIKNNNLEHQANGYRAGGLYIQPFHKLRPLFKKHQIKYDFSVFKGAKSIDPEGRFSFDYSNSPKSDIYQFNEEVTKMELDGEFIEFSLNHLELKNLNKVINGVYYRLTKNKNSHKLIGDGNSSGNKINNGKVKKNYLSTKETISIELMNPIRSRLYMKTLKKSSLIHFISHPKLCSEHSLDQFDIFLKKSNKKYRTQTSIEQIISTELNKIIE